MKLFHISDLHFGKRVNGISMLEDQRYIMRQIWEHAEKEKPDAVLIAGDLYDKQLPSAEAVETVDEFLYGFMHLGIPVYAINGNHDSAERIAYGARMMDASGIHMCSSLVNTSTAGGRDDVCVIQKEVLCAADEQIANIYLLPYLRTAKAVEEALRSVTLSHDHKNILVMHQFLLGASVCESEEISVGGADMVSAELVKGFDYVALGHLHGPQTVGYEHVRYSGSPLKYSFSETNQRKSVTVVQWEADNVLQIRLLPLIPRLDMREICGPFLELLKEEVVQGANAEDYLHVTLTDKGEIIDAIGKLRAKYPNIMRLDFARNLGDFAQMQMPDIEEKQPLELFSDFYRGQLGEELDAEQTEVLQEVMKESGILCGNNPEESYEDRENFSDEDRKREEA